MGRAVQCFGNVQIGDRFRIRDFPGGFPVLVRRFLPAYHAFLPLDPGAMGFFSGKNARNLDGIGAFPYTDTRISRVRYSGFGINFFVIQTVCLIGIFAPYHMQEPVRIHCTIEIAASVRRLKQSGRSRPDLLYVVKPDEAALRVVPKGFGIDTHKISTLITCDQLRHGILIGEKMQENLAFPSAIFGIGMHEGFLCPFQGVFNII